MWPQSSRALDGTVYIRTPVPVTKQQLTPNWSYLQTFRNLDQKLKDRLQSDFISDTELVSNLRSLMTPKSASLQGRGQGPGRVSAQYEAHGPTWWTLYLEELRQNRQHLSTVPALPSLVGDESTTRIEPSVEPPQSIAIYAIANSNTHQSSRQTVLKGRCGSGLVYHVCTNTAVVMYM